MHMETSRRSLLKTGVLGALVLAAGGGVYRFTHPPVPQGFVLDGAARAVLVAVVPALVDGMLPDEQGARSRAIAATVDGVNTAILGLPLALQKEVQDLFGLLALAPARRWLAGVPQDWNKADADEIRAWLQRWRRHRIGLLRDAYQALRDLVLGSWYGNPANWAAIGYPGPIAELA
jgi:hypothetical protein